MSEATKKNHPATRQFLKTFLSVFVPMFVILTVFQYAFFRTEWRTDLLALETTEHVYMDSNMSLLAGEIRLILSDLAFLSESHELQAFFDNLNQEKLDELNEEFLIFCRQKQLYDQIRYLDETGREVSRINFNNGSPAIVPASGLQDKGDRYYFKETIGLKRGKIFVSPFDLNMEGGQIEQPLKPMVRFASPVFDRQGRRRGIVILNYLGKHVLDKIKRICLHQLESGRVVVGMDHPVDVFLVNREGYWLYSADPDDQWGFMYEEKRDRTLGNAYPEEWRTISSSEEGI